MPFRCDNDGSGFLEREEFRAVCSGLGIAKVDRIGVKISYNRLGNLACDIAEQIDMARIGRNLYDTTYCDRL